MLRKRKFKSKAMRKAMSKTEAERTKWERLARKATAANDDMTLRERLQRSLAIEQAKKAKRDD